MVDEARQESKRKNALLDEFSRVYEALGFQRTLIIVHIEYEDRTHTFSDGTRKTIYRRWVRYETIYLDLKGLIETLLDLYPQIEFDDSLGEIQNGLENCRKLKRGLFGSDWDYDEEVFKNIYVYLEPLRSKVYIAKAGLEDLAESLFLLRSQDPKIFLEPLVALRKDTDPIRNLARKMKEYVADNEIWKNYRNILKQLNPQLKRFGLKDHYENSEKMMTNIDGRYQTSNQLHITDRDMFIGYMNEILDVADVYDSLLAG